MRGLLMLAAMAGALASAACGRVDFDAVDGGLRDGAGPSGDVGLGDGGSFDSGESEDAGLEGAVDGGTVFDPTLVMWLAMEDDPSDGVAEASGQVAGGATCAPDTCPTGLDGPHGRAILFDGIDDGLVVSPDALDLPTMDYTWEAWVAPRSTAAFSAILSINGGPTTGSAGLELDLEGDRLIVWAHNELIFRGTRIVALGRWTHVAMTREDGTFTFYVDGVRELGPIVDSRPHDFGGCPLLIGVDSDDGCTGLLNGNLDGSLDEIRIYSRALSSEEINTDMMSPTPLGSGRPGAWSP